ncbi:MAG: EAL domain-containing protein [Sulfuritalea sp.]|nr:EAL domain-containing protein [Sulfuritalea sp.]
MSIRWTGLQHIRIGTRIGLALALPILGVLILSVWILTLYFRTANDMRDLRSIAELAPKLGDLVHAIQKERGIGASTIGAGGADLAAALPARQAETNQKRAALAAALVYSDASRVHAPLAARIADAMRTVDQVDTWRRALAERRMPAPELARLYGDAVIRLIGIVEEILVLSTQAELTRSIYAYLQLLQAKESAGLERAIGAAGLAAGQFDIASQTRLAELIDRQRLYLDQFRFYATPGQIALLDHSLEGIGAMGLGRMRLSIGHSGSQRLGGEIRVADWLDTTTRRIDQMKLVEDSLAADLIAQARRAEEDAWRTAKLLTLLAAILLALAAAVATALARGIIRPMVRMSGAMTKLAARDETVEITAREGRRGDEIGDMARAMMVFRENLVRVAQAEERLKNEAILRLHHQALASISQGVIITDAERRITYANAAFQRITGYSEAEILGLTPAFLHNLKADEDILGQLATALAAGSCFSGHLMNFRKDGTPFWSDLSVTPVVDKEGRTTHFVGITRDITESRQMQQELRIAATAFESLHGIIVTDANGIILRVNQAFTELTGYSPEEVVGHTPAMLKSGRHDAEFYAGMWRQLKATGAWFGEIWDRRKNGEVFPKWQTISAVRGLDGQISHYVAAFSDISESKAAEDEIRNLAFFDPLTRLPNRRLLLDRLQHALATSARNRRRGVLLFIDLDNFKHLNDSLGHDKGDLLLQQVAARLSECVREGDTVARLGGDEFVLMLEDLSESAAEAATQAEIVGEKIVEALNRPYLLGAREYHCTPSIGLTLYSGHDASIDELLQQADLAMYRAKAAGRNTLRFFEPDMQVAVTARSTLEADLRKGLQERQFMLFYQPQVGGQGQLTGVEALVRWNHPQHGMIAPNEFIPLAEETGLILPLGQWVLETACAHLAAWRHDPARAHLTMAVNVSARQFRHQGFVDQVLAILVQSGANPDRLKLELTESLFLDDVEDTIVKMTALKDAGVRFSLDDFGTGYSSLSYLKRLPLDQLKIDRSFIRDVLSDANDAAIARTIVTLAHSMGLTVIAEGVETEAQREFLTSNNCHAFQGFLFGKAVPPDEIPYS